MLKISSHLGFSIHGLSTVSNRTSHPSQVTSRKDPPEQWAVEDGACKTARDRFQKTPRPLFAEQGPARRAFLFRPRVLYGGEKNHLHSPLVLRVKEGMQVEIDQVPALMLELFGSLWKGGWLVGIVYPGWGCMGSVETVITLLFDII